MAQEAEHGSFTIPVSNAQEMIDAATSVKVRIVREIKSEGKSLVTTGKGDCTFSSPPP
jgi:hypothetical protein